MTPKSDGTTTRILFTLISSFIVVVVGCFGMSYAAHTNTDDLRLEYREFRGAQEEQMKNIVEGVARNAKALERIEDTLRR